MDQSLIDIHNKLQNDLEFFCQHAMKIKTKDGQMRPFFLNKAQKFIHAEIEKQRIETGRVRVLILKGRQQGCSTYTAARFYHKATRLEGKSVFILSHDSETTDKLFSMVERFHENCIPALRPETRTANRRKLEFEGLNSEYFVGTAGSGNVGRGGTVQLFHGSEVAFWMKADEISAGVMESVADLPGTEAILESTANGIGNMFYDMCMAAMQNKSQYKLIFIPWFWQEEYAKDVPSDFVLSDEEEKIKESYKLTDEQIMWRRAKIEDFDSANKGSGEWKFKQEYPCNPIEAFQTSGDSFIKSELIVNARKTNLESDPIMPLIMGVDPSGGGKDRAVISFRRGRRFLKYYKYYQMDEMEFVGIIANFIKKHNVKKCFIDYGYGGGIVSRLHELGFEKIVTVVNFGASAIESDRFVNKRAEMAVNARDWFMDYPCDIPDDDEVHADFSATPLERQRSNGKILLESKDVIRDKYKMSTDIFDSFILTFAYPVHVDEEITKRLNGKHILSRRSSGASKTFRKLRAIA